MVLCKLKLHVTNFKYRKLKHFGLGTFKATIHFLENIGFSGTNIIILRTNSLQLILWKILDFLERTLSFYEQTAYNSFYGKYRIFWKQTRLIYTERLTFIQTLMNSPT